MEKQVTAQTLLRHALQGVGDLSREKLFRMNITVCIHRGTLLEERELLKGLPPGMAGAPVEILQEQGIRTQISARPCLRPSRKLCDPARPDLWIPVDCGVCPSCLARKEVETR